MNISYLAQFYNLSKHTTMREYAKEAGVTPAQVSRMVLELEKEFGASLLVRKKNGPGIQLTEKGKALISHIPIILGEIKKARSLVDLDKNTSRGTFNLYSTHVLIDKLLSPNLHILKERQPDITLNLFGTENILPSNIKRQGLSIAPYLPNAQGIVQKELASFHVGLWASKKYLERYGEPKHPSELKRHTFIAFEEEWKESLYPTQNWWLKNDTFEVDHSHIMVIKSNAGTIAAAESGMGIFSLSEEAMKLFGSNFTRILPDLKGPEVKMCLTYPEEWKGFVAIKEIEDFVTDLFKNKI